jgi:hypothetical protein
MAPSRELFRHAMQRAGQIADLARGRQRRTSIQVTGRNRLRDVPQLDDRPRHGARECPRQHERPREGDDPGRQYVALCSADDLTKLCRRHRYAHVAERMTHGEIDLVVTRGRAPSHRRPGARTAGFDDLGPLQVILQCMQCLVIELRVALDDAGAVDERDAVAERRAGGVGERVGAHGRRPLRRDEPCLAGQALPALLDEARVETAVEQRDDEHDQHADDEQ